MNIRKMSNGPISFVIDMHKGSWAYMEMNWKFNHIKTLILNMGRNVNCIVKKGQIVKEKCVILITRKDNI